MVPLVKNKVSVNGNIGYNADNLSISVCRKISERFIISAH